jgi:hypothetical protein
VRSARLAFTAVFWLAACGTAPKPVPGAAREPTNAVGGAEPGPRPADADADVAYYQDRAAALASEVLTEVARTNFVRMRRGRLYLREPPGAGNPTKLQFALTEAFKKDDSPAILEATRKLLADDQADIRGHMLRAVTLRRLGRESEANFHRQAAIGLVESIVSGGDGRSFATAWTVFRVKEEYEVLKAAGYLVERQSMIPHGDRSFDVIDARKVDGGEKFRAHFDITELFAEEGRALRGR